MKLELVKQPTATTCVHACLSMLSGIAVEDIVKDLGDSGVASDREHKWYRDNGYEPIYIEPHKKFDFKRDGVYLATVPSLNKIGGTHRIVILADSEAGCMFKVFDPNRGKARKYYYSISALEDGACMISDLVYPLLSATPFERLAPN